MAEAKNIIIGIAVIALILLAINNSPKVDFPKGKFPLFAFLFSSLDTKEFKWNDLDVVATSSTDFGDLTGGGDRPCSNWGALVKPTANTNGSLYLEAYSSFGQCSGNGASSGVVITIKNIRTYRSIFLKTSGYARTGYGGTSNCPSASAGITINQYGNQGFSVSSGAGCVGTDSTFPSGILINIEGDYLIIPSSNNVVKLTSENDLKISASVGANGNTNGRSGRAMLSLESIEITKRDVSCSITYEPVCSEGVTYFNQCFAEKAGKISLNGECKLINNTINQTTFINQTSFINTSIIIKPTCASCPSDTECLPTGENVICLKNVSIKEDSKSFFSTIPTPVKVIGAILIIFLITRLF